MSAKFARLVVCCLAVCFAETVSSARLAEPLELYCNNTEIELHIREIRVDVDGQVSFSTRAYHYMGTPMIPGPTIRMRAGTKCKIRIVNELSSQPCYYHANDYHCPDTHTLHTHGLHVSPDEDDINTHQGPGESEEYTYSVSENHLMGTHWYHAHHHGSTTLQVAGGLLGALLVDPAASYSMPDGLTSLYAKSNTRLLVLTHVNMNTDDTPSGFSFAGLVTIAARFKSDDGQTIDPNPSVSGVDNFYAVNGQYQPEFDVPENEVVLLRIVHATGTRTTELEAPAGCSMTLLARDGVFHKTPYLQIGHVVMVPGTRADVALRCTATVGSTLTFPLVHSGKYDIHVGEGNRHTQAILFHVNIVPAVSGADSVATVPTDGAALPAYLGDLTNDPDVSVGDERGTTKIDMGHGAERDINGIEFTGWDTPRYLMQFCVDRKYEVQLGGRGSVEVTEHPYHQHINHFQITSYNNVDSTVMRVGEWRDVVPQGNDLRVRFKAADFTGAVVAHCHLLEHEDEGLMGLLYIHPLADCDSIPQPLSSGAIAGIAAGCAAFVCAIFAVSVGYRMKHHRGAKASA